MIDANHHRFLRKSGGEEKARDALIKTNPISNLNFIILDSDILLELINKNERIVEF